jgi:hypothetical protein
MVSVYVTYTNSIEFVQRKFLKYLSFKEDGTYPPVGVDYDFLCSRFNFTPLKVRRVLDTVTFLFKLFHNKVDCSTLLNGLFISLPHQDHIDISMFLELIQIFLIILLRSGCVPSLTVLTIFVIFILCHFRVYWLL